MASKKAKLCSICGFKALWHPKIKVTVKVGDVVIIEHIVGMCYDCFVRSKSGSLATEVTYSDTGNQD